jgi:hypothetical protein
VVRRIGAAFLRKGMPGTRRSESQVFLSQVSTILPFPHRRGSDTTNSSSTLA